jgi:bifunctional pyridoxal-dependent enzyme with beta-cystathionase and maltose regulon repressor activities
VSAINAEAEAKKTGLKSAEHYMEQWLIERAHVQLNPGSNYGAGGEGHMRMNIATPRPLIDRAIDLLAGAIRSA